MKKPESPLMQLSDLYSQELDKVWTIYQQEQDPTSTGPYQDAIIGAKKALEIAGRKVKCY